MMFTDKSGFWIFLSYCFSLRKHLKSYITCNDMSLEIYRHINKRQFVSNQFQKFSSKVLSLIINDSCPMMPKYYHQIRCCNGYIDHNYFQLVCHEIYNTEWTNTFVVWWLLVRGQKLYIKERFEFTNLFYFPIWWLISLWVILYNRIAINIIRKTKSETTYVVEFHFEWNHILLIEYACSRVALFRIDDFYRDIHPNTHAITLEKEWMIMWQLKIVSDTYYHNLVLVWSIM